MTDAALTSEQILQAAEEVLRRYGPAKATVVDVARALRVSHGSVYRHFPSKTALREAVAERWLVRAHAPLAAVLASDVAAPQRLRDWLSTLFATKRAKALDDPELFATYMVLVGESSAVVEAHVDDLIRQVSQIIEAGVVDGDFAATDVETAARAVCHATARFHDPVNSSSWSEPGIQADFDGVCALILSGLLTRKP